MGFLKQVESPFGLKKKLVVLRRPVQPRRGDGLVLGAADVELEADFEILFLGFFDRNAQAKAVLLLQSLEPPRWLWSISALG